MLNFSKQGILIPHPNIRKVRVTFNSGETETELLNGKLQTPRICRLGFHKAKITAGLGEDFKTRAFSIFQVGDFLHLLCPARE